MRSACVAVIVTLAGCSLPEPRWVGAHVELAADPGLVPCGDVVGHMDAYIEQVAAELQVAAPTGDDRIGFYWLGWEGFAERTICINDSACSLQGDVFAVGVPVDHELVHALVRERGLPTPLLLEGLAVAYEVALPSDPRDAQPIKDVLAEVSTMEAFGARENAWLPARYYPLAGAFVAFLIERHGVEKVMRLYAASRLLDGIGRISRLFERELGEPLVVAAAAFEASVGDCPLRAFRLKRFECAAPELAWDGVHLRAFETIGCEQGAVGPFGGADAVVFRTVDVPEDGVFEVAVVGDAEAGAAGRWNRAIVARCGGCEGYSEVTVAEQDGAVRTRMTAGRHSVVLLGPVERTTGVGLRIDRVADEFP